MLQDLRQQLEARKAQIEQERQRYHLEANAQLAAFSGQLAEITYLLTLLDSSAESGADTAADPPVDRLATPPHT